MSNAIVALCREHKIPVTDLIEAPGLTPEMVRKIQGHLDIGKRYAFRKEEGPLLDALNLEPDPHIKRYDHHDYILIDIESRAIDETIAHLEFAISILSLAHIEVMIRDREVFVSIEPEGEGKGNRFSLSDNNFCNQQNAVNLFSKELNRFLSDEPLSIEEKLAAMLDEHGVMPLNDQLENYSKYLHNFTLTLLSIMDRETQLKRGERLDDVLLRFADEKWHDMTDMLQERFIRHLQYDPTLDPVRAFRAKSMRKPKTFGVGF